MQDQRRWASAWARLEAFRGNLPTLISQDCVQQYHTILADLQVASGEDLDAFRIPADKLAPRVTGFRPGGYSGRPGQTFYSKEKYCNDQDYFRSQLDGLYRYLKTLDLGKQSDASTGSRDYWSMSDTELERLADQYHLNPVTRSGSEGQFFSIDRTRIIAALVQRDRTLTPSRQRPTSSVVNYGEMHGSVIQQGIKPRTPRQPHPSAPIIGRTTRKCRSFLNRSRIFLRPFS